ncbi:DUF4274 domain-containing protein [Celerinatantimonas sp. MCCC 1A17872]|uniref:DUF4274 domain-containing protein n=1 Tax=Celerinatantimonas sp. MCCC 1A17872 TaxID=3177514 RepID=UPI0038BEB70E
MVRGKKLTAEQCQRVTICAESGFITSQQHYQQIVSAADEHLDLVQQVLEYFKIDESQLITIDALQTKEEVFAAADHYQWGDDTEQCLRVLQALINHPLCDAGTAILLFFKGCGYDSLSDSPMMPNPRYKEFYSQLIERFKNKQFHSYSICFSPIEQGYMPNLDEYLAHGFYIPGEFLCPYATLRIDTELE